MHHMDGCRDVVRLGRLKQKDVLGIVATPNAARLRTHAKRPVVDAPLLGILSNPFPARLEFGIEVIFEQHAVVAGNKQ